MIEDIEDFAMKLQSVSTNRLKVGFRIQKDRQLK